MANEKIQIDIAAKDEASPVIKKLATKIDGLEADEARIVVTADTKKLQDQLDRARIRLGTLTGDEYSVQARLVGTLDEDLDQAKKLLADLEGQTTTVKIDSVGAKQGIDELGKSADSSKSVLANMVGNATQDLGALGGVAGSAGVAIGQMGEYMADARASGEKFGSIIKNFATVGVPLAALSVGIQIVTSAMKSMADSKAFNKKQVTDFANALREGATQAEAINAELRESEQIMGRVDGIGGFFEDSEDIVDDLVAMNFNVRDIEAALGGSDAAWQAFIGPMKADLAELKSEGGKGFLGLQTDAQMDELNSLSNVIEVLTEKRAAYTAGTEEAAAREAFYGATVEETRVITEAWNNVLATGIDILKGTGSAMGGASDKTKKLADGYRDARDAADELTYANQLLRGDIDQADAWIHLQQQFDETKRKGQEAMDAVKNGASDARDKMFDYQLSVSDSKTAVMDFNDEWGTVDTDQTLSMTTRIERGEFDTVLYDVGKATSTTHWIDVRVRTAVDTAWNNVMNSIIPGSARINGKRVGP